MRSGCSSDRQAEMISRKIGRRLSAVSGPPLAARGARRCASRAPGCRCCLARSACAGRSASPAAPAGSAARAASRQCDRCVAGARRSRTYEPWHARRVVYRALSTFAMRARHSAERGATSSRICDRSRSGWRQTTFGSHRNHVRWRFANRRVGRTIAANARRRRRLPVRGHARASRDSRRRCRPARPAGSAAGAQRADLVAKARRRSSRGPRASMRASSSAGGAVQPIIERVVRRLGEAVRGLPVGEAAAGRDSATSSARTIAHGVVAGGCAPPATGSDDAERSVE